MTQVTMPTEAQVIAGAKALAALDSHKWDSLLQDMQVRYMAEAVSVYIAMQAETE